MKNIEVGGLYIVPDYVTPLYNIKDPTQPAGLAGETILLADTPFVPLELHEVILKSHFFPYKENVWYRVKILTSEGIISWLSLTDTELDCLVPMTSCDK